MLDLDSNQAVGARHLDQTGHFEPAHPKLFGELNLTEAIDVVAPCDRCGEDQLGWTLPLPGEVGVRGAHLSGQPIILWLFLDIDRPIAGNSACDCEPLRSDEPTHRWKGWSSAMTLEGDVTVGSPGTSRRRLSSYTLLKLTVSGAWGRTTA